LAVGSIVALLSWSGIMLTQGTGRIAAIWLSNGFTLAILLCQPRRRWLAYLAISFLGNIIADALAGDGLVGGVPAGGLQLP
jgi:integral membrane sensor domain MASE1